jgi:hypothetical protein
MAGGNENYARKLASDGHMLKGGRDEERNPLSDRHRHRQPWVAQVDVGSVSRAIGA